MDVRQIRYFQKIAELGGYNRAAAALRVSQPALSRQILKLERELGVALMRRDGRGIRLTEAGHRMLELGRGIVRQIDQARDEIASAAEQVAGHVTLGVPPAAGASLVAALIERLGDRHAQVTLEILGGFSSQIEAWLASGQIDLGILHDPKRARGIATLPLLEEELCLVGAVAAGRRLRRTAISFAEIGALPLVLQRRPNRSRAMVDRLAGEHRLTLDVVAEVDSLDIIKTLVRKGLGFGLLTLSSVQEDLQRREVVAVPIEPRVGMRLMLAYRMDSARSRPVQMLAELVPQLCRDLVLSGRWAARLC